jgi:glycosyltransferase involved in cell wall biosynthesis
MSGLIVHEWIEANGGAEKVVAAMVEAFPDADVLALWDDAPGTLGAARVRESWLARTPLRRSKIAALPVLPLAWRGVVPTDRPYDFLLVSSHLFAHHARVRGASAGVPKLVYAHTPARYIWVPELDARGDSAAVRAASAGLRPLDRRRAQEATAVAANSSYIRARIAATWEREAEVIHPPVDVSAIAERGPWAERLSPTERAVLDQLPEGFLLGASRMVPYKALDRVIRAGELTGRPVVLAGGGPDAPRLRALAAVASVPVRFLGRVSTPLLYALYERCAAYVFPPIEDFGIMPVEAMAAGAPVLCHAIGGAKESLEVEAAAGVGGSVDVTDDDALAQALGAILADGRRVPPGAMDVFSRARFVDQIQDFVARHTS